MIIFYCTIWMLCTFVQPNTKLAFILSYQKSGCFQLQYFFFLRLSNHLNVRDSALYRLTNSSCISYKVSQIYAQDRNVDLTGQCGKSMMNIHCVGVLNVWFVPSNSSILTNQSPRLLARLTVLLNIRTYLKKGEIVQIKSVNLSFLLFLFSCH